MLSIYESYMSCDVVYIFGLHYPCVWVDIATYGAIVHESVRCIASGLKEVGNVERRGDKIDVLTLLVVLRYLFFQV